MFPSACRQPFGYDDSDLDLDHFCELLGAELKEIVAHPNLDFEFVFSEDNQPFGPDDTRSASEILEGNTGVRGFHQQLAKHYRESTMKEVKNPRTAKAARAERNRPHRTVTVFSIDQMCAEPDEMGVESQRGSHSMV